MNRPPDLDDFLWSLAFVLAALACAWWVGQSIILLPWVFLR